MPYLTLSIDAQRGPLIDLLVGVSTPREEALKKAGLPIPVPIPIRMLIDTGASGTCIDSSALDSLNLAATGRVPMLTPSTGNTPHFADQYDVSIAIPHERSGFRWEAIAVLECQLAAHGIQGLLGRNALDDCFFAYNGEAGIYTLAF